MLKNNSSKSLLILTTAISSLMMVSCSSDDDNNDGVSNTIQPPEGFDSVWVRDCQLDRSEEASLIFVSFVDTVIIEGNRSTRTRTSYSDTDCQLSSASISHDVTVQFGESFIDGISGLTTYPVDLFIDESRVTPETQELTDSYNDFGICGLSNYVAGESTVIPTDCAELDLPESTFFVDLWAVDADLLYFGLGNSTLVGRPETLDFEAPYSRQ